MPVVGFFGEPWNWMVRRRSCATCFCLTFDYGGVEWALLLVMVFLLCVLSAASMQCNCWVLRLSIRTCASASPADVLPTSGRTFACGLGACAPQGFVCFVCVSECEFVASHPESLCPAASKI